MCSVCLQSPCHPSCPNAEPEKPVYVCVECGNPIYVGDKFFPSADGPICKECMEEKTVEEILDLFGDSMEVAKEKNF